MKKIPLRSLESSSSSSLTTTTPVNTSSHNSSWDEVRTVVFTIRMINYSKYNNYSNIPHFQSQPPSVTMQGGRGKSFFPVRAKSMTTGGGGGEGGGGVAGESSNNLNSFYSIPPPNFSFRPGVSTEKLL